jgi:predicted membrane-bound dolichyl-phosphate-mannose-protein mannosyltransferase
MLRTGVVAGIIAAVILDAYRLSVDFLAHGRVPEDHYRYVASAVLREGAYALPGAAWLGLAMHLTIGAVWGIAFAWAASSTPEVLQRPVLAGVVFGALVYIIMRFVTVAGGIAYKATPGVALFEFVAHTIFFGIPLAFIIAGRRRAA